MALVQQQICVALLFNICRGATNCLNGSLLVLTYLWLQQSQRAMEKIDEMCFVFCYFFTSIPSKGCIGSLTWQLRLPVLHPRPYDGLIELRNLPLQHRPQALSKAVVVLLQLLLVLLLVRRDQVFVLLHCLTTPAERRTENPF